MTASCLHKKKKLLFLEFLFFCIFITGGLVHFIKIPSFFQYAYISQELFLLSLLFICILYVLILYSDVVVEYSIVHLLLLICLLYIVSMGFNVVIGASTIVFYFLLLCVIIKVFNAVWISYYLSFVSIVAALLSLYEHRCFTLDLPRLSAHVSYLAGFKDSISHFGIYGQINLLACLLLVGLFAYAHLLYTHKLSNTLSFIPISVISITLFLTRCRSGLLALVIASLSLFYLLYSSHFFK